MDYQFIVGKLSDVIWHSAILVSVVGIIKLFLTQFFLYKITVAKKSELKFTKNGKSASYSNYEDNAEKVINLYRNVDADDDDFLNKTS